MAEWDERTKTTGRLIFEILRLANRLGDAGGALIADLGLTPARWQVLGTLRFLGRPETVAGLARRLGLARQSVQRVADDLRRAGLVERIANPADRRAPLLRMTDAGRAAAEEAEARRQPWTADLAAALEGRDITEAEAVLATLRKALRGG